MTRSFLLVLSLLLCSTLNAQDVEAPKSFSLSTQTPAAFDLVSTTVTQKVNSWELENGKWKLVEKSVQIDLAAETPAEASPTPLGEVRLILATLAPKPNETLVDWGCGDARFLIEAARRFGCKCIGIEIDLTRAANAQRLVDEAGLSDKIRIFHGDSTKFDIKADVGVAYLYEDVLQALLPQIRNTKRFASYIHAVPGLDNMVKVGDSYFWKKPQRVATRPAPAPVQQYRPPAAVWNGRTYTRPVCNNPNCRMCNSIRAQLGR